MTIAGSLIAIFGIIGALSTYAMQRALDRSHAILSERRRLYDELASLIAVLLYKQVNINSEHHAQRRDALNIMGQRISILAPQPVRECMEALVGHLGEREKDADPEGNVAVYFDEHAKEILDNLLSAMRKDTLPPSMLTK